MKWINNNQILRQSLTNYYNILISKNDNQVEAVITFQDSILDLKNTDYNVFKTIIGLMFIDKYVLLKYKERENALNDEESILLETYSSIDDIEELISLIAEDLKLLCSFIGATFKFNNLNNLGQAVHVCNIKDIDFIKKFSLLSCLEREYYLQYETLDSLIEQYKIAVCSSDEEYKDSIKISAKENCIQSIKLKKVINVDNYNEIVFDLVENFYKWKKFIK